MNGLRVLNTRPLHQAAALDQAIRAAGGLSINFPALTIQATPSDWLADMPSLVNVNQAIFISANAVNFYFDALKQAGITWPLSIRITAVGCATAAALSKLGILPHHIPSIADSEHLLKLRTLQTIHDQTILLIKGIGGRPLIAETLVFRGASLISLCVYRSDFPDIKQEYINSLWQDDAVDIILFTSTQAMHNFFSLFSEEGRCWIRKTPCLVISERLAETASTLGINKIIRCQHDTVLEALKDFTHQGVIDDNQ